MDWSRGSGRVRRVQSNSNCDGSSSSLELMLELSSKARCCMAMAVGADEMAGKSVLFSGHLFRPVSSSFSSSLFFIFSPSNTGKMQNFRVSHSSYRAFT